MSFDSRDLMVRLIPGTEEPGMLLSCNICDSTPGPGKPKPCPSPTKPACQAPSAKPKPPKKRTGESIEMDLAAMDLALLRGQLRDTLSRL